MPSAYRDRAAAAVRNARPGAAQLEEVAGAIGALSKPRNPADAAHDHARGYSPDDQTELNRLIQQRQTRNRCGYPLARQGGFRVEAGA